MGFDLNLDLFSSGIAIAASMILGFVFFFKNTKDRTGRLFLMFTLTNIGWIIFNYLSYKVNISTFRLQFIRLIMFFAILQTFFYFLLMKSLSSQDSFLNKKEKYIYIPLLFIIAALTFSPLVFSGLSVGLNNYVAQPIPGPAIALFGIMAIYSVYKGSKEIYKKIQASQDKDKKAFKFLLAGALIMFASIIVFSFLLPTIFENTKYIPISSLFTLPFVFFTGYAIIRHKLLSTKIISTEILVFLLSTGILFEVILSNNLAMILFRSGLFFLILGVGILLIKSVLREVKQRERLEILGKELQEANIKLQALDKARAEFITIASHQLRTPPTTIKWYLSSILDGDYGKLKTEQKEALEKTNRTNNSLISLIDDMLNVSRIERGKMEFLFEQANLLDLAKITFEQLEPIAKEKGLKLTFKFSPKTKFPKLMADKEKIRQVMNNLIDNALKYTKQGSVAINLTATAQEIKFSVTDTGKGITSEDQNSIFEKYTRGKESVKQSAGLGLGLYVAKIIINQHKGKVWAESSGEGQGSIFAFTIPINNNLKQTTLVDLAKNQA